MQFENLNIIEPIQKALKAEGYKKATPIQEMAIPELLKGKDLIGCAQTGTGKTAAFAVPILQGLADRKREPKGKKTIKALILAPTRELAIQIGDSFKTYGRNIHLKTFVIYGGVSQNPQTKQLGIGVDILVATPGRLLDLINQKYVHLDNVQYFVLDEADYMLDMGMIHDVRKIIQYIPKVRQTMLFSATMPTEIAKLADRLLDNPVKVAITPVSSAVDVIEQSVYFVNRNNKTRLLAQLLKDDSVESALVFSRTKHGANKIVKLLEKDGIVAEAIHGNKSQNKRQAILKNFKEKRTKVLIATDIAARGIDVNELSHVFNYNLPEVPETYVHRIGRTGRAGLGGVAISFCDQEERLLLRNIEKLISKKIPVVKDHPFPLIEAPVEVKEVQKRHYSSSKGKPAHRRSKTKSAQSNSHPRKRSK